MDNFILTKTLLDGIDVGKIYESNPTYRPPPFNYRLTIQSLDFLGETEHEVVICQAIIDLGNNGIKFCHGKTVFSLDLEKTLHVYEPANLFCSIHFPLNQNIFRTFQSVNHRLHRWGDPERIKGCQRLEYYPHYETIKKENGLSVEFTGIVQVANKKRAPLKPKLYSFRRPLEVKELSEETHKPQIKRLKK